MTVYFLFTGLGTYIHLHLLIDCEMFDLQTRKQQSQGYIK